MITDMIAQSVSQLLRPLAWFSCGTQLVWLPA
jgi:hypothetical protein